MMRKIGTLLAVLLTFNVAFGQTEIRFLNTTHSFGKIRELDGVAECSFKFVNAGKEPLKIQNVQASCGCTVPEWPKEPLNPGDTGTIKALYNTNNRPGGFTKSVTVTANTQPASHVLSFSGFVVAKQQTLTEDFPYQVGSVRFSSETVTLGAVSVKDTVTKELEVFNHSDAKIAFSQDVQAPKHIKIEFSDAVVSPGSLGKIKIIYLPALKNEYGEVSDELVLVTNEDENKKKKFTISAEITDARLDTAGSTSTSGSGKYGLTISLAEVLLDTVKAGSTVQREFEIKNNGKQDLIIRKISSPGHIKVDQNKGSTLKPGQKLKIKLTYNSKGKIGAESSVIKIYSNDTQSPVVVVPVKGEVVK